MSWHRERWSAFCIVAFLAMVFGRYLLDQQRLQRSYDQWQQNGIRAPAPPAVSGAANHGRTEEGVHDR